MVLILGDSPNELMNPLSGVLECLRLAVLVWRISDNESVLADVDRAIIANAGSKPSELSGFGC